MTETDLLRYVETHLPDFVARGTPERLPEGNLNVVWRVPGEGGSLIVKHAPPYVASNPDVDLDPNRIVFELRSLEALSTRGALADVRRDDVRPPRPVYADPVNHVLIMEDVGDVPTVGRWLQHGTDSRIAAQATEVGRRLGGFIGRLHRTTLGDEELARQFDNRTMQETRHAVQYQAVGDLLHRAGVEPDQPQQILGAGHGVGFRGAARDRPLGLDDEVLEFGVHGAAPPSRAGQLTHRGG